MKTQYYKEKGYEFDIKRQCKALSISCNKFIEAINNRDINLAKMSFGLIISGCKNIRTTIPPIKYKEIHKKMRKACTILMKLSFQGLLMKYGHKNIKINCMKPVYC